MRGRGAARAGSRLLVVHANQTDSQAVRPPRVGLVVSKGVGGAVVRNRVKRRLRAQTQSLIPAVPIGVDLVVRAQQPSAAASSAALGHELERLLGQVLERLSTGSGRP